MGDHNKLKTRKEHRAEMRKRAEEHTAAIHAAGFTKWEVVVKNSTLCIQPKGGMDLQR